MVSVECGDILIGSPDLEGGTHGTGHTGVPRAATNRFLMLCNVDPRFMAISFLLAFHHRTTGICKFSFCPESDFPNIQYFSDFFKQNYLRNFFTSLDLTSIFHKFVGTFQQNFEPLEYLSEFCPKKGKNRVPTPRFQLFSDYAPRHFEMFSQETTQREHLQSVPSPAWRHFLWAAVSFGLG